MKCCTIASNFRFVLSVLILFICLGGRILTQQVSNIKLDLYKLRYVNIVAFIQWHSTHDLGISQFSESNLHNVEIEREKFSLPIKKVYYRNTSIISPPSYTILKLHISWTRAGRAIKVPPIDSSGRDLVKYEVFE